MRLGLVPELRRLGLVRVQPVAWLGQVRLEARHSSVLVARARLAQGPQERVPGLGPREPEREAGVLGR